MTSSREDPIEIDDSDNDDATSRQVKSEGSGGGGGTDTVSTTIVAAAAKTGTKRERSREDEDGPQATSPKGQIKTTVARAFEEERDRLLSALKAHTAAFGSLAVASRPSTRAHPSTTGDRNKALAASAAASQRAVLPASPSSLVGDGISGISELNRIFGRDDEEEAGEFVPITRPLNPVEVMLSQSGKSNDVTDRMAADRARQGRLRERGLTIWTLYDKGVGSVADNKGRHRAAIVDRDSRFEAFVVVGISCMQDVADVLMEIRSDGKIAAATHSSMYACRVPAARFGGAEFATRMTIAGGALAVAPAVSGGYVEMGDDDGEEHAASKLMTLLRRSGGNLFPGTGVMAVVCRWYGGKLLGPVRFQHITSIAERCMRQVALRK